MPNTTVRRHHDKNVQQNFAESRGREVHILLVANLEIQYPHGPNATHLLPHLPAILVYASYKSGIERHAIVLQAMLSIVFIPEEEQRFHCCWSLSACDCPVHALESVVRFSLQLAPLRVCQDQQRAFFHVLRGTAVYSAR